MFRIITVSILLLHSVFVYSANNSSYYGVGLCNKPGFKCITVKRGQSWQAMFPDEHTRDLVQRLNRTDTYLHRGRKLVVPIDPQSLTLFDISPFPKKIKPPHEKVIIVNQDLLAWGAFNPDGQLIKWGPIASGKDFCPDINRGCRTVTGVFYMFNKQGGDCESNTFPVGRGGSSMPYCMFFFKGYAMHGSKEVVGRRASHGCVRMFTRDAKWLNHHFVEIMHHSNDLGTKVIVQKITE